MSLNTTFSVTFVFKGSRTNSKGLTPIYLRVTLDGKRFEYSTKIVISKNEWINSQRLTKKSALNKQLKSIERKVLNCYNQLLITDQEITVKKLKDELLGKKEKEHTLIGLAEYHNDNMEKLVGKKYSYGTLKNYRTTLKYLKEIIPLNYNTPDLPLKQLNHTFLTNYEVFLTAKKNCSNNGVMKQVQRLKKLINLALKNQWIAKDPFSNFKIRYSPVDRDILTLTEIERLKQLVLNNSTIKQVRDYFIFSCYTGLSYADVKLLSTNDIQIDDEGYYWIIQNRQKSKIRAQIPLLPEALSILNCYSQKDTLYCLPVISNQKTNAYLKELAQLAKINKRLHFHVARHTFATTITLSNNIPIETVSKMLGHNKLSTTQIYAKVLRSKILNDMSDLLNRERG